MSESILLLHLTYYIKFIFLIFIFEVSGFIAIRYLRKKKILSDHTRSGSIICGFLIFLFFYTLLKVDTISLNFGIFGIICIYAFLIRSEKEVDCNSNSSLNNLLIPKLLFSFICFELAALYFIKGGSFPYITPNQDYGYWKATASFIQQYGIENTFHYFSNINPELSGVMVYHYIEMWCAALLSDLSGVDVIRSYFIFLKPLLFYFITQIAWDIVRHFRFSSRSIMTIIFPIGALLYGNIVITPDGFINENTIHFGEKLLSVKIMGLLFAYFIIKDKIIETIVIVLMLTFIYPTLVLFSFFYLTIVLIKYRNNRKIVLLIILSGLFSILFLLIYTNQTVGENILTLADFFSLIDLHCQTPITIIIRFMKNIYISGFNWILIILSILSLKQDHRQKYKLYLSVIFISMMLTNAISSYIFPLDINYNQFFTSSLIFISPITFLLIFNASLDKINNKVIYSKIGKPVAIIAISILILIFTNKTISRKLNSSKKYSDEFIIELTKTVREIKPPKPIGVIFSTTQLISDYYNPIITADEAEYICHLNNVHGFINTSIINDFEVTSNKEPSLKRNRVLKKLSQSSLIKYKKENNVTEDSNQLIQQYIEYHKFSLVIVTPNSLLPSYLLPRVDHLINDPISGETVYLLKWL